MKNLWKKLGCTLVSIALLASAAGCATSNNGSSDAASPASDSASVEAPADSSNEEAPDEVAGDGTPVTIWISSGAEDDIYREMLEKIGGDNPDVAIKAEFYEQSELLNKLRLAPEVGDAPEVLIIDALQIPYFQDLGLIANVDSRVSDEIKGDFLQSVIDECSYDGELYAVAQFDSGMAFWANKSMLEEADVRIPTSYTEAWDRAEFEDALAKLKASGVEYPLYLRQNNPSSLYFTYLPIVRSFGGDFLDRSTLTASGVMDSAATIEAYDYISWLIENEYINQYCDYEDAFYGKQESALALIGHWKYTEHVTDLGDDAIIIPLPDMGNGVYTGSGSTIIAMTSAAEERGTADAAWAVIEQAISPECIEMVIGVNGALPSRKSVMDSNENYQEGGRLYLYREQLEAGISYLRPLTPAHATVYDAMKDATSNIILGADAGEELREAAAFVDEIIMENSWNK